MSEVYVGKTNDGFEIVLPDQNRTEHVQVIASTGRGKTLSVILPWMVQDFVGGRSVILIDGKGDQEIVYRVKEFAEYPDDVIVFDLNDVSVSACTNPLRYGSPQQIADRVFTTFEFENRYYETVSYEALLLVLELMKTLNLEPKLEEIYRALTDDGVLSELLVGKDTKSDLGKLALSYLAQPFKERQERLSGFLSQLRPYATGELAELVNGNCEGRNYFSLSDVVRESSGAGNKAVLILIPALLYQKSAARLGQMFLQEIAWASANRRVCEFLPVFLDECVPRMNPQLAVA